MNAIPKNPRFASPKYLNWVRELPCVVCGMHGHDNDQIVAHHAIGIGHMRGIGIKTPDSWAVPMHATCHAAWHQHPDYDAQRDWVMRTATRAIVEIAEGRLRLD